MREDEQLFSGLTVMSPEETMAIGNEEIKDETKKETTPETTEEEIEKKEEVVDDGELTITTPVPGTTKTEDETKTETEDTTSSSTVYSAFIRELGEEGIVLLPEDEAELATLLEGADAKTLKELMSKTVDGGVEDKQKAWKEGLNSSQRRFLDIEGSFEDTDTAIQMTQRLEYFDGLSTEKIKADAQLQGNLYYEDLKSKNFSHEDAVEAIEEAKTLGKLEEKALKSLAPLKANAQGIVDTNKEKMQTEREATEKGNQDAYDKLMTTIDKTESLVEGIALNKVARQKLKDNIVNPVFTTKEGEKLTSLMYKQRKNPEGFDMIVNYMDTLGVFDIDKDGNFKPNLSKLKTIAKTKAVSELDTVLNNTKEAGQGNSVNVSKESEGIINLLKRAQGQPGRKK